MTNLGTYENPQFQLEDGSILELKHIKATIIDLWQKSYNKKYPPPNPPEKTLSNGQLYRNYHDDDYKIWLDEWDAERQTRLAFWLLEYGVKTEPPKTWKPVFEDLLEDYSRKQLWLYETLSPDEISQLGQAIMSLNIVSEKDIEESEKN